MNGLNNMIIRIRSVVLSERGQLVIPEEIRKDLNLKSGEALILIEKGREIILKKESDVASKVLNEEFIERMSSALLSEKSLAKDWLSKGEDKAWSHL